MFVALNDAGVRASAFVYVPRGVILTEPISLRSVQARTGTLLNQRTLVVLEEGAQAEVWEQFLSGSDDVDGVFNTVTELVVGAGARLRYVCGQGLSEKSWIFGAQRAEVGRDASLDWVALGFGSARGHVRMETRLAGEGAEARVTGAYASHARQHIDFDTTQEHAAPNTTSDLAFRGVLQGRSTAVWKGNIIVDPGRAEDRRVPGVAQPAAVQARPRRRDPRARDPGQRRALHACGGGGAGRPRAAVLPALARTAARGGQAARDRGLPGGAGRALRGRARCASVLSGALERRLALILGD